VVTRRTIEARILSWKGAAVQRGLEPGSTEIAIVRSSYQETSSEDNAGWERLSMVCKMWKSATAL
jgi:hypothetical protein